MPATRAEELRFARQARLAMRRVGNSEIPYSEIRKILLDTQAQLEFEIATAASGKSGWSPTDVARLREANQRAIAAMTARLRESSGRHIDRMALLGGDAIPESLERAGVRVILPEIDIPQIALAKNYSATLVQRVGQDTIDKIDNILFTHTLGARTPYDTQRAIAQVLRTQPSRSAPGLGPIMSQAERIYRTEGMRIANMTNQIRMNQASEHIEGMRKMWLHGGGGKDPRKHHRRLHGRVLPMDADFVYTDMRGHKHSCYGPHDPKLPAGEVINCTCTVVPVVPGSEAYNSTKGKILRNKIRSQLVAEWTEQNFGGAVQI